MLKLYTYFRSSAAYRVRIALNLKGLPYEAVPVHMLRDGGQQHSSQYTAINPSALIPTLQDGEATLTQSLAIIEYLDDVHPTPALLPADPLGRARVRALALAVACDIHPLNNLRVLRYLEHTLGVGGDERNDWYRHWVETGFAAIEKMLLTSPVTGRFCHGDTPTLADCCLIPQVFNAERFKVPMGSYPTISAIAQHCQAIDAFRRAAPDMQPDAE